MQNGFAAKLKKTASSREFILIAAMIVAAFILSIFTPVFISKANILSMLMSITVAGMVSIGMVFLLACGVMDLSAGMTMAFTGVIVGLAMKAGIPVPLSILVGLAVALLIGLINGVLVAKVGLNAFITTLGMSCAIEGLMLVLSDGHPITGLPASFKVIGQGSLLGIQIPILVLVLLIVVMDVLLKNSRVVRQVYFVGSNIKAAKLNGINVAFVIIGSFCLCALFAGIAGVLITARFGLSSVTIGADTSMDAITACIIGGASLSGGKGSVLGAVLGALFLTMLSTALNLLSINIYWQNFVTGSILVVAIFFDAMNERKARGKAAL